LARGSAARCKRSRHKLTVLWLRRMTVLSERKARKRIRRVWGRSHITVRIGCISHSFLRPLMSSDQSEVAVSTIRSHSERGLPAGSVSRPVAFVALAPSTRQAGAQLNSLQAAAPPSCRAPCNWATCRALREDFAASNLICSLKGSLLTALIQLIWTCLFPSGSKPSLTCGRVSLSRPLRDQSELSLTISAEWHENALPNLLMIQCVLLGLWTRSKFTDIAP
jgi:hypothetical protein